MKSKFLLIVVLVTIQSIISTTCFGQEDWNSKYFTPSDQVKLHYIDVRNDTAESVLIFITGWTMPAWIWEKQIDYFSHKHRVIALDPRGQGKSEKPNFGYEVNRRAKDMAELIDAIGSSDPIILIGWSLGVYEVMHYLKEFQHDHISGQVLVDWSIYYDNPASFTNRYFSLQTNRKEWTKMFVEAIFQNEQLQSYKDSLIYAALQTPDNAAAIMIGNIILGDTDLRPFMDLIDPATLFIYSSNNWSVEAAKEIRINWPQFEVEVIDDTSHALFVDQPDRFNEVVSNFIQKVLSK